MPSLKCPHCQRTLRVGESAAGKELTCPGCQKKFRAPRPPSAQGPPAPPPVATADRPWHLHVDGRNVGPYSAEAILEQIKAGKADRETLAWKEGMGDWKPLKELDEFRKSARGAKRAPKPGEEGEGERRHRYAPGRGKRDVMVGAWIAVGLGIVLVVVILVISKRPRQPEITDPAEYRLSQLRSATPTVRPPTATQPAVLPAAGTDASAGKTPKIIKKKKAQLSNEELLAKTVKEIDEGFAKVFADPGKADYMQLVYLQRKCTKNAAELKGRNWGSYQSEVERYAGLLEETASSIQGQIKDISQKWAMGREGLDEKVIAKDYPPDIAFMKNWHNHVNEAKAKIRAKGLQF